MQHPDTQHINYIFSTRPGPPSPARNGKELLSVIGYGSRRYRSNRGNFSSTYRIGVQGTDFRAGFDIDVTNTFYPFAKKEPAGGGGYNVADYLELAGDLGGTIGGGAKNILDNRGAYMPWGQIYKVNKPITVRTPVGGINTTSKVLNYARVGGKVLVVGGVVATGYQVYNDAFNEGKYYGAGTRLTVAGVAAGAAFIPVVGWGVAAGIGVADFIWGDQFYNWVETNMGD